MKTLKTLAKKLDFSEEYQYFDYCIDSYLNGNFSQCKILFYDMKKEDRKGLLKYIQSSGMLTRDVANCYSYYFLHI